MTETTTTVESPPVIPLVTPMLIGERKELARRTICKNLTADDFELFCTVVNRTGLDPFAKQIHAVTRYDKLKNAYVLSIQTSIDGYRLIASRTREYQGQTKVMWCGADGEWKDVWLDPTSPPSAARVGVYRKGFKEPLYRIARWDSYAQYKRNKLGEYELVAMWAKMPDLMLAKCAEALALRAAFPQELSGLYTTDEMMQAGDDAPTDDAQKSTQEHHREVAPDDNLQRPDEEPYVEAHPVMSDDVDPSSLPPTDEQRERMKKMLDDANIKGGTREKINARIADIHTAGEYERAIEATRQWIIDSNLTPDASVQPHAVEIDYMTCAVPDNDMDKAREVLIALLNNARYPESKRAANIQKANSARKFSTLADAIKKTREWLRAAFAQDAAEQAANEFVTRDQYLDAIRERLESMWQDIGHADAQDFIRIKTDGAYKTFEGLVALADLKDLQKAWKAIKNYGTQSE